MSYFASFNNLIFGSPDGISKRTRDGEIREICGWNLNLLSSDMKLDVPRLFQEIDNFINPVGELDFNELSKNGSVNFQFMLDHPDHSWNLNNYTLYNPNCCINDFIHYPDGLVNQIWDPICMRERGLITELHNQKFHSFDAPNGDGIYGQIRLLTMKITNWRILYKSNHSTEQMKWLSARPDIPNDLLTNYNFYFRANWEPISVISNKYVTNFHGYDIISNDTRNQKWNIKFNKNLNSEEKLRIIGLFNPELICDIISFNGSWTELDDGIRDIEYFKVLYKN